MARIAWRDTERSAKRRRKVRVACEAEIDREAGDVGLAFAKAVEGDQEPQAYAVFVDRRPGSFAESARKMIG